MVANQLGVGGGLGTHCQLVGLPGLKQNGECTGCWEEGSPGLQSEPLGTFLQRHVKGELSRESWRSPAAGYCAVCYLFLCSLTEANSWFPGPWQAEDVGSTP